MRFLIILVLLVGGLVFPFMWLGAGIMIVLALVRGLRQ